MAADRVLSCVSSFHEYRKGAVMGPGFKLGLTGAVAALAAIGVTLSPSMVDPHTSDAKQAARPAAGPLQLRLAEVGEVSTYQPVGPPRGFVLFLSGDGGWNLGVVDMARALTRQGVIVAGVSTPAFLKSLETSADRCVNPNYALTDLAADVEHRLGFAHYIKPILAGYSSGATLAYAALAQAPPGTYRAAVSLGFSADIPGKKPWCAAPGFAAARITKPEAGWLFRDVPHLPAPWIVLQGLDDQVVSPSDSRRFTLAIPEARVIELPGVGHGFSVEANWMPQFSAAFTPLLDPLPAPRVAIMDTVADLPLTTVSDSTAPRTDTMAVLYSGDGGWAGLDRTVAQALAQRGIPVVGIDSLSYFWTARTPDEAARDLGRILSHYSAQWQRPKVILTGYSFGADDLPFIFDKMVPPWRDSVTRISMLAPSGKADFQFHLANWLDISGGKAMPIAAKIAQIHDVPMQCVRGASESDSPCVSLASAGTAQIVIPGGHHFGGDAEKLAGAITNGLKL